MPNFVKSKFTGLLKGLLRRFDDGETATVPPPPSRTGAKSPPAPAATPPPRPRVTPPPNMAAAKGKNANDFQLPLQPVIDSLPMELRAKIVQQPPAGATLSLPVDKVLPQLAHGAVKITFGELRLAAPGLFVNSGGENDSRPIALPLSLILAQLSPSQLARRPAAKLEVSDDITGPFGSRAEGVNFTSTPTKAAPTPLPKGADAPAAPVAPIPVTPPPTFTPRATPAPTPPAPTPVAKAAPTTTPPLPKPAAAVSPKTVATPAPSAPPLPAAKPVAATPPTPPSTPVQAPVPPPPPATPVLEPSTPIPFSPGQSSSAGGFNSAPPIPIAAELTVIAPLAALLETWPDALKMEIVQNNLSGAQAALPLTLIEPGLKRGRITVTWKNLRGMIRPTPPPVSVHDPVEVELPLKVVAPLFLSSKKAGGQAKQKTISVSTEIPNLFTGSKHSEPAMAPLPAPAAPPPPTSAPAASSWGDLFTSPTGAPATPAATARTATPPAPTGFPPAEQPTQDTNYYARGETAGVSDTEFRRQASPGTDFLTRGASPKDIVTQAAALPGVTGAVIALPDGLKVASDVPAEFNADMLSAFLPQIFARTSQSTKELRMGELNNLSFTVGNVPWKVFRVNAVYFAAFGRAGEPLPTAQLASLAVLLDRKNK